jgi:hypothetical protein
MSRCCRISAAAPWRDAMGHRALENLDAVLLKGTAAPAKR